ncbi:putative quorum-sensing-regulated virulence factor [Roseateles sp.]|uniref:putative quorum-sensing-regulated virulence factor n=1 Tax=Roseateles sp. TaxID=1971397 RepID=UPI00387E7D57
MNPEDLLKLVATEMPFGKHKGSWIANLPGHTSTAGNSPDAASMTTASAVCATPDQPVAERAHRGARAARLQAREPVAAGV